MATAEQLKALLRSHAEGDENRFYAIAMQVAARAARQGHGKLAQELRALIDEAKTPPLGRTEPTPLIAPRGELAGILAVSYPKVRLDEMILESRVRDRLVRVLKEYRQQERLRARGLEPRRKLLLLGPPGSGKTMTSAALAGELQWPLLTIQLDGLITKYMGETATKLRLVFESIAKTRGVYLFDEFDAIGVRRDSDRDVGEIRRILNSFLQFLESDASQSLIVAATNHPDLLDPALSRRFDDSIHYGMPTDEHAGRLMRTRLSDMAAPALDWKSGVEAARGLSYAEISRACLDAAKDAILDDRSEVLTADLVRALEERRGGPGGR
jgi:SpoVK/Ycf46/Vps4 family AAA+-type ATPase